MMDEQIGIIVLQSSCMQEVLIVMPACMCVTVIRTEGINLVLQSAFGGIATKQPRTCKHRLLGLRSEDVGACLVVSFRELIFWKFFMKTGPYVYIFTFANIGSVWIGICKLIFIDGGCTRGRKGNFGSVKSH